MSYPAVAAAATYGSTANATSHDAALPAGLAGGDLLLLATSNDGDAAQTTPTDWTRIVNTAASTLHRQCVYVKVSTGSEGPTLTVPLGASEGFSSVCYRITGWNGSLPADVEDSNGVAFLSANPNPPSLTASWGDLENLFIATVSVDNEGNTISAWPTDFTGNQTQAGSNQSGSGTRTAMATCNLANATKDPDPWTLANTGRCVAATIVVRPSGIVVLPDPFLTVRFKPWA